MKKTFNGTSVIGSAPIPLLGVEVLDWVNNITIIYVKTQKKDGSPNKIWKKRSIFFYLPYWCNLHVRHCLDVMHVEKNVCDSLIGTLLNIKRKIKYGLKYRQDLAEMGIRQQLHLVSKGLRTYLPPACHTMSTSEKKSFCHCLKNLKVPQGYSSNIKSLVLVKDLKLVGLKPFPGSVDLE